ncbi:putative emp24/gp25L/p24 family/GOLD [Blattamonas nauphoetae]|uniref:Emp24/gp25L/p24 family/GOLD n=1 Tax=Blattamonas nauphoetae TaxID=2049346 RepID=A0ABQ9Y1Y0_9EUKA|nr:putative emp24/gp25L/p24 family/GOLD [Blattamonas nauphoetae]
MIGLCVLCLTQSVSSIMVELIETNARCFSEELDESGLFSGHLKVIHEPDGTFDYSILSPDGNLMAYGFNKSDDSFSFNATRSGDYEICFQRSLSDDAERLKPGVSPMKVNISLSFGIYSYSFEREESSSEMDVSLNIKQAEQLSKDLLGDFVGMRAKEVKSDTDKVKLSNLITTLSVIEILVLIGFGVAEVLYLNKFFREQKVA